MLELGGNTRAGIQRNAREGVFEKVRGCWGIANEAKQSTTVSVVLARHRIAILVHERLASNRLIRHGDTTERQSSERRQSAKEFKANIESALHRTV
jgi:hypothetical protein